jgi:hypothetical protein
LFRSAFVFVQTPLHDVVGCGQPHPPLVHAAPPVQTTPQAPQSLGSFLRSTQAPAQSVVPVPHDDAQDPWLHTWLDEHAVAHAPQCAGSVCRLTQTPLQSIAPPGHAHAPFTHAKPTLHV